ncbi:hypothetical protein [Stenotrophomonas sp.]|uniref:hypothetical protein n=1 Tax=Stenotrophomonas sp. TaxID=69392 RepID=UPI0028B16611|nr:hypothetical protein [Stenotrophomonas sp.]
MNGNALHLADFDKQCLFTGSVPVRSTREHVVPKWFLSKHDLHGKRLEMGAPQALANIRNFQVPAEYDANQLFGTIEKRIERGQAGIDEIHLWHKKISAGLALCHWTLSLNAWNPRAPALVGPAALRAVVVDFQSDFADFKRTGTYARNGSTIALKSPIPDGWFAHVFGSVSAASYIGQLERPFALVATSVGESLYVSMLNDAAWEFEKTWNAKNWGSILATCHQLPRMQAALAAMLTEVVDGWSRGCDGRDPSQSAFETIAYQLGIELSKGETWGLRRPSSAHLAGDRA